MVIPKVKDNYVDSRLQKVKQVGYRKQNTQSSKKNQNVECRKAEVEYVQ